MTVTTSITVSIGAILESNKDFRIFDSFVILINALRQDEATFQLALSTSCDIEDSSLHLKVIQRYKLHGDDVFLVIFFSFTPSQIPLWFCPSLLDPYRSWALGMD